MPAYSQRYDAALALAARAHQGQTRKGSDVPYIVHPVHVSVILIRHGLDEQTAIAGLLHDVVEDQDVPLAQIEAEFGPDVAAMVEALSERKKAGGVERPWEDRKRELLDQLRAAGRSAVAVKAADAIHNIGATAADLRRRGPGIWRHFKRGPEQTIWYYRQILAIVGQRLGDHPLAGELQAAVDDLARAIDETRAG
jgi:(p)ppGpp synthase/HD superfamily hydrolase